MFPKIVKKNRHSQGTRFLALSLIFLILSACAPIQPVNPVITLNPPQVTPVVQDPTPVATRPVYDPGTLVDYTVQSGDTLFALAAHFNTTIAEILEANPEIPKEITSLSPGTVMQVPIYYEALWGNPFQILPDAFFINGPAQTDFDARAFVNAQPGWLKDYASLAGVETRRGGDLIDYVARNFSISPRLLLAIAEYQAGALTNPTRADDQKTYPLGFEEQFHQGFYLQLVWAANALNNGYYGWRSTSLDTITRLDGSIEHPDPWQNAATVAIQHYFSLVLPLSDYTRAIYSEGLIKTYTDLFGDPWGAVQDHISGDVQQPDLKLPFATGKTWTYSGGPHAAWGDGQPFAALDFAPPAVIGGCASSAEFVTAMADGQIVRTDPAIAILDLDGDGDERTGWVIFYLHLGLNDMVRPGVLVKTGDPIGHPSCEGGSATGTHVHIARKYNGEWMLADGVLGFNLDGWIAQNGKQVYQGTLKKFGRTVEACTCSDPSSQITAGK